MPSNASEVRLRFARKTGEVTDHHNKATGPDHAPKRRNCLGQCCVRDVFRRHRRVRGIWPILVLHQFVHVTQRREPAETRPQLAMRCIAEYQSAKPVAAMMCRPGNQCRSAARIDGFETTACCEMHVAAKIRDDQYRPFSFLAE